MNAMMMQGGETKEATSVYKKGMEVMYKGPNGLVSAKILDVHFDDLLEPYYTILKEDGVEKQTDNAHLTLFTEEDPPPISKPMNSQSHQGDVRASQFNRRSEHQRSHQNKNVSNSNRPSRPSEKFVTSVPVEKWKKYGLCVSCGIIQTHKPGIWKSRIPKVSLLVHSFFLLHIHI